MADNSDHAAQIKARIAALEATNAAAPEWGAALGARHEEIQGLKRNLARLERCADK